MSLLHLGAQPAGAPEWGRSADDTLVHAYLGPHTVCSGYTTPLPQDASALHEVAFADAFHEPEDHGDELDQDLDDDSPLSIPLGPDVCPHCVREITRLHTQAGAA